MVITVKYFGAIAELLGKHEEQFSLAEVGGTLTDLKHYSIKKHEKLSTLSFQMAVNQNLATEMELNDGDEVAFLPPFAGG